MSIEIKVPKKLIEVALPLDAINVAAGKEKSIRHGHPSTLHMWWARRPLAAARAVIFAQMVNDPGYERELGRGVNKEDAHVQRERLFRLLEQMVKWENVENHELIRTANAEIMRSWKETCELNRNHPDAKALFDPNQLPEFYDPFAGGGAIPLEAQRLGLSVFASDLNPVAVLINKAMIELPPYFANQPPVGDAVFSNNAQTVTDWPRVNGLAEDIIRFGAEVQRKVSERIGRYYPNITVTKEMILTRPDLRKFKDRELSVLAYLWTRTVGSPNPAFSKIDVPIASSFLISDKDEANVYIYPIVSNSSYKFTIQIGRVPEELRNGTKLSRGANFKCLMSGVPIEPNYIKAEGRAGRIGKRMMAIIAECDGERIYLDPTEDQETTALAVPESWRPPNPLPDDPRNFWTVSYGLTEFGHLFTERQLLALNTFAEEVSKVIENVTSAKLARLRESKDTASEPEAKDLAGRYGKAIGVYLAFVLSKCADYWSSIATWMPRGTVGHTFSKQAIPMTWDYPEANPFADFHCSWLEAVKWVSKAVANLPAIGTASVSRMDAAIQEISKDKVISTDPPYYDNIAYADLSDYFLPWLNRTLGDKFPETLDGFASPKSEELVATPYRHGGKLAAEKYFLEGMTKTLTKIAGTTHPAFPITIYYAFKQSESDRAGDISSTGWETFLEALLSAGLTITGTWPLRTERANRSIGLGTNALASSILLVCRKRGASAATISRREFMREINLNLPDALLDMTSGGITSPVAPVDLSQAIIGPGMSIFSKYSAVLEADGRPMSVKTALQLINRFLAEDDFDSDSQFCLKWFESHGWDKGSFGDADVLARAKGTTVDGLKSAGVLDSGNSLVRLLKPSELDLEWLPEIDSRISVWEILHQMIAHLIRSGESGAGDILAKANNYSENIRILSYRLHTFCERKGWSQDAAMYDQLVRAWDGIESAARSAGYTGTQISLFGEDQDGPPAEPLATKKKTRKKKR